MCLWSVLAEWAEPLAMTIRDQTLEVWRALQPYWALFDAWLGI